MRYPEARGPGHMQLDQSTGMRLATSQRRRRWLFLLVAFTLMGVLMPEMSYACGSKDSVETDFARRAESLIVVSAVGAAIVAPASDLEVGICAARDGLQHSHEPGCPSSCCGTCHSSAGLMTATYSTARVPNPRAEPTGGHCRVPSRTLDAQFRPPKKAV